MDNYSISSIPDQETEKSCLIKLKGELSIHYIRDIKSKIDQIIKDVDTVEILVSEANVIDLTMMQYLLSLKKSEKSLGKIFSISFEISEDLKELLEHGGFKHIENLKE